MLCQACYLVKMLNVDVLESIKKCVLGCYASSVARDRLRSLESYQSPKDPQN